MQRDDSNSWKSEANGSPALDDEAVARLKALSEQFHKEAEQYEFYGKPWVKAWTHPSGAPVFNVFIVGAGHCGSGIYWGLKQFGIDRVGIIDARPAKREGVWAYYERMHSIRTPKELTGVDCGYPSLTFRSYCTARFGEEYWQGLKRVLRRDYADYMTWFKETLQIPIQNETRLVSLEPDGELLRLVCEHRGNREIHFARNVVLSTGYFNDGEAFVPPYLKALPASRWAHAKNEIPFQDFAGKRIGILGHGAGAFDCAGVALEAGAETVDLCFRRKEIPTVNPYRWFEFPGFVGHFHDLDEATRWKFFYLLAKRDQPPAQGGYERAMSFPNFRKHPSTNWLSAEDTGSEVVVETTQGRMTFDFIIAATGLNRGVEYRAELAGMRKDIATWADKYTPPQELESTKQGAFAFLGPNFEFMEKHPGTAPHLKHVFAFSTGAAVSHGPSVTSLSGVRYSLMRVLTGIRSRLFTQDKDAYLKDFMDYDKPELKL